MDQTTLNVLITSLQTFVQNLADEKLAKQTEIDTTTTNIAGLKAVIAADQDAQTRDDKLTAATQEYLAVLQQYVVTA